MYALNYFLCSDGWLVYAEADKAKEKMLADKLKREAMNADKKITTEVHETTTAAYNIMITPWEREIYVITMIKIKINEYCDKIARGEAAEFGKYAVELWV